MDELVVDGTRSNPRPGFSLSSISKRFGGVAALNAVDLSVAPGEIHGLIGENGSGKSTLVKIIAGYQEPEAGAQGSAWGAPITFPLVTSQLPIAVIHQDLGLVDELTVVENFGLGTAYGTPAWRPVDWASERREVSRQLKLLDLDVPTDRLVGDLESAQRAAVAIARAMRSLEAARNAGSDNSLLILDEPTAFLSGAEAARIANLIRSAAANGTSIILISHHLGEVVELCDSVTVLRDGRVVARELNKGLSEETLARLMLGRSLDVFYPPKTAPATDRETAVQVNNLSGGVVDGVSFSMHFGEILGVTGLVGMGQQELPYLMVGDMDRRSGTVTGPKGQAITSVSSGRRQGVALVPGDRRSLALQMDESGETNLTLPVRRRFVRRGFLRKSLALANARELFVKFGVRPDDPSLPMTALSGGNQQKVALARWIQMDPSVLLLDEPTQGVDAGARKEIIQVVADLAVSGCAVAIFSTDLEQLAAACHRVIVLNRGVLVEELVGENVTEDRLHRSCTGVTAAAR